jgi:hypothetical protein
MTNDYENKSGLLPPEKQTQSNPILSASGGNASADSVLSFRFLTITICCVLPRLPKYTPVAGFGVKNGFFQKAVFDVNKWPCHTKGAAFGP